MRTTLKIDDKLLRRLKLAAADSGRTLSQLAEEAIGAFLTPCQSTRFPPITLPVSQHDLRLRPGVNLDSDASIAEAIDDEQMEKLRATSRR
jgi:hypothetical protein